MITQTTKLLYAASLSTVFALSGQGAEAAKETEASEVYELDDFVVTEQVLYSDQISALKTPTPIINVPQSLSLMTSEEISLRGFNSVEDIVNYTPGVNISQGCLLYTSPSPRDA